MCPSNTAPSLPAWDSKGNHLSALKSHITMLLGSAETGGYCHISGQICEEPAPHVTHRHAGPSSAPIWGTATCPPLPCLLCYTFAELHDSRLNKDCVISAQSSESLTQQTRLLAGLPYLAALVGTGYAHTGLSGQTEGRGCPQGSRFLLCCAFKRIGPFSYLLPCPQKCSTCPAHRGAARRPQTHCSRSKEEMGYLLCLLPKPCCRPLLICTTHLTAGYRTPSRNIQ